MKAEEGVVASTNSAKAKLTGRQKWAIAGLLLLQILSSVIFYPLAALFSLTGIGVPLSVVLLAVGAQPFHSAMKYKEAWQQGGGLSQSG